MFTPPYAFLVWSLITHLSFVGSISKVRFITHTLHLVYMVYTADPYNPYINSHHFLIMNLTLSLSSGSRLCSLRYELNHYM
jgi:hypothetical protein